MVRTLTAVTLTVLAMSLLASPASAATKNGITPQSPGASVSAGGSSPTFKARIRGEGSVFVRICKSAEKDRTGLICSKVDIAQMKRRSGRTFTYKPRAFTFPAYYLNRRGTYFWQAYRINAERDKPDVNQEGPISRFSVK